MHRLLPIIVLLLAACAADPAATPSNAAATPTVATATAAPTTPVAVSSASHAAVAVSASTPPPATTETGPSPAADVVVTAKDVARRWIDALAGGDYETAHGLLGGETLEQFPTADDLAAETGFAEGWGAFGRADDIWYDGVVLVSSGDGALGVVTVTGTVDREGTTEDVSDALPFLASPDETTILVDPLRAATSPDPTIAARYGIEQPAWGATVACDTPVVASIPGADALAVVDGYSVPAQVEPADGDQSIVTVELEDGYSAGKHLVTIGYTTYLGQPGGWSVPFTVTDGCG